MDVTLVMALINLAREGSADFNENPVLHFMSILSPVVVVVLLAVTAFHHCNLQFVSSCGSFPKTSVPVFAFLVTKIKAYPIIADYLKDHVITTNTWIWHRKGRLTDIALCYAESAL